MGAVPRDTDGDGLADTHNEVFFLGGGNKRCPLKGRRSTKKGGFSGKMFVDVGLLEFYVDLQADAWRRNFPCSWVVG